MPEESITPQGLKFLRPPARPADAAMVDRLDVLIAETRETNRLLAELIKQGKPSVNIIPAEPARPTPPSTARARGKAAGK